MNNIKYKIILLFLILTNNLFAEDSVFKKIADNIEKNQYKEIFIFACKLTAFLLVMAAIHQTLISDNQQKTRQEKFWSSVFMYFGAIILSNILDILKAL